MIFKKNDAKHFANDNGCTSWLYNINAKAPQPHIGYTEADSKSPNRYAPQNISFVFYIIEGTGVWQIGNQKYSVEATDMVVIPPQTEFSHTGKMKFVEVAIPDWGKN